ncbi:MAG: hypothetical protein LBJ20_00880 [Candidatus Methanoplasma sp.]|jgi:preprotein translocase subunit SecD|nr:hypothetical protein [Candidatus Methanoplasma sp.]
MALILRTRRIITGLGLLLAAGWMSYYLKDWFGVGTIRGIAVTTVIGFAAGLYFAMGVFRK